MVHRNFESTEEMVNNLLEMESKLSDIERMLASDSEEILGPAPNLLTIHYQLNQLEQFRNQTMHRAKRAKQSSQETLEKSFRRLNSVIVAFDQYILQLAGNVLSLVRAGQPDVVVKLVKVVELEGREDEKVSKIFPPDAAGSFVFTLDAQNRLLLSDSSRKLPKWTLHSSSSPW